MDLFYDYDRDDDAQVIQNIGPKTINDLRERTRGLELEGQVEDILARVTHSEESGISMTFEDADKLAELIGFSERLVPEAPSFGIKA